MRSYKTSRICYGHSLSRCDHLYRRIFLHFGPGNILTRRYSVVSIFINVVCFNVYARRVTNFKNKQVIIEIVGHYSIIPLL